MNRKTWLLMSLVFWLMSCDGTKTIWLKGYVERSPEIRRRLSAYIEYATIEDAEWVEKEQRFTVWPNRKFLIGIRVQDYLYINTIFFDMNAITNLDITLEDEELKRRIIDLGILYDYDSPSIKMSESYDGSFNDLSFEITSYIPDVDYFNVIIFSTNISDFADIGKLSLLNYSNFIKITGLKSTNVSLNDFSNLTDSADAFMINGAQVTIYGEIRPGIYAIAGDAIRIVDDEQVVLAESSIDLFEISNVE